MFRYTPPAARGCCNTLLFLTIIIVASSSLSLSLSLSLSVCLSVCLSLSLSLSLSLAVMGRACLTDGELSWGNSHSDGVSVSVTRTHVQCCLAAMGVPRMQNCLRSSLLRITAEARRTVKCSLLKTV